MERSDRMESTDALPEELQKALAAGLRKRLPLTFLPFVNQQLRDWEMLFPNERRSVQGLLLYVAQLSPDQSDALFREVVRLEEKMGVRRWGFSTNEQTIQNSSQLARSPFFQEWRRAVQVVFDTANRYAIESRPQGKVRNRLILLDFPPTLPLEKEGLWRQWQGIGKVIELDLSDARPSQQPIDFLLLGTAPESVQPTGVLQTVSGRADASPASVWVLDAGEDLVGAILQHQPAISASRQLALLSYVHLDSFRQQFSHEMNTMRKDLADADSVFDRLRSTDVRAWCPPEIVHEPAIREFIRSLYLSGNGAVIFANSFVEWGASEALRRARPIFLAARFGFRDKPKPFTGVAVFDNPDEVNPIPPVQDAQGSAIDAEILALYIWLAANRYPEYEGSTACICLAESISQAYVVAPGSFELDNERGRVTLENLQESLRRWLA